MILGAPERLHSFALRRARGVDVPRDRRRANETQRIDTGVMQQRIDRVLVALHDVEYARRKARFADESGEQQRGGRVALGGLEDEGVAADECDRKHPHRHHGGEVERRDTGDDTERLPQRVAIDAGADVVGDLTLQQLWRAAGELDNLEPAGHFTARIGDHLAVLGADQRSQFVGVRFQQLAQLIHES